MSGRWKLACFVFGLTVGLFAAVWINFFFGPAVGFWAGYPFVFLSLYLVGSARQPAPRAVSDEGNK